MKKVFSMEQMRNYVLMYVGIVVLLILFFFLNSVLSEEVQHDKKVFNTSEVKSKAQHPESKETTENKPVTKSKIQLIKTGY